MFHVAPLNADPAVNPDIGERLPPNPWEVGTYAAFLPLDTCHACMIGACIQRFTFDILRSDVGVMVHGSYGTT